MRLKQRYCRVALCAGFAAVLLALSGSAANAADPTIPPAPRSGPPAPENAPLQRIPANAARKILQTNGSGTFLAKSTGPSTSGFRTASEPGGYCSTYYQAWDDYGQLTVNGESMGYCSGVIDNIGTYVQINGNPLGNGWQYLASSASSTAGTYADYTVASKYCGSYCSLYQFQLFDSQTFTYSGGWSSALGGCTVSGTVMQCAGYSGTWSW